MHHLVPEFIIENLQQNRMQDRFECSVIFVDISGFTPLTETLMAHGQHGAEVLANVMREIFTPLVHAVFAHQGFVTNFAGDAFTAVFPNQNNDPVEGSFNALAAANHIQNYMVRNAQKETRYGSFNFSIKIAISSGETAWGIVRSQKGSQAAYYFKGSAIDDAAAAEKFAMAGDIIVTGTVFEAINLCVSAQREHDFWRILEISAPLPPPVPFDIPEPDKDQLALFSPRILHEQEISGEFRQVVSLFIRLKGNPEHEEMVSLMRHVFALRKKYGGLLNRIDFGDKGCHLLLFWGAPVSYENDVTRALEFILDLQRVSEIPLRAGMTYRIAHAGCSGSSLAEEYTCYGRGVNLAARFMVAADWDQIWIDHDTAKRAEVAFHLRSLGNKLFKGIAEPQQVFRLDGWREQTVSPFGSDPLVGRGDELGQLRKAFQPLHENKFAGVMTICGDAGIGKSHLVHAFLDERIQQHNAVFICQTDEILRQSLNPFRYFLRQYFDQSTSQDEDTNKRRFGQIMTGLLWSIPDQDLKSDLERRQSFLGSLLGLHWENSLYEQLDPELRFENTLDAVKVLIKAESLLHPVIILLEDAHWLDDDSIQLLIRLTRNVDKYPFALLVTSRSEMSAEYFDPQAPQFSIRLQALDPDNVTELIAAELGYKPSASLVSLINRRTDGNPFFVQQMLLFMRENELLERVDKLVDSTLPGDVYVPTDVRTLLTARLDRLPLSLRDVIQKAAVLGREFERPILQRMVNHSQDLTLNLETGDREDIWFALDEERYIFRHALLRDAAYDMQLQSRLRELHRSAAQAFEDRQQHDSALEPPFAQMAYHFDRAEDKDQARGYYGQAGDLAKNEYHNEEAIAYFSRGLELTPETDPQGRYRLICGRETIEQWQGKRDAQRQDLDQLAAILHKHPDDLKKAELALRQSSFSLVTGDYETAVAKAQQSLKFAQWAGDIKGEAKAYHRLGRTLWQQGRAREAEAPIQKGLQLVLNKAIHDIEAMCHYDLVAVYFEQANYEKADIHLENALKAYETLNDQQGLINCQNAMGVISYARADYTKAITHYEKAQELCRQIGWRYAETRQLTNIGNNYFDLGNYELARSYHQQSLIISREIDNREIEAISLDTLGLIAHHSGAFQEAVSYFQEALEILAHVDNKSASGYTLTHLGYVQADLEQFPAATSSLKRALTIRRELGARALEMDTLAGLAQVSFKQNQLEDALSRVNQILDWIDENSTNGIELPVLIYLICFEVLEKASKDQRIKADKVQSVLKSGYVLMQDHANQIKDPQLRKHFIENVPYNRLLQEAWLLTQE